MAGHVVVLAVAVTMVLLGRWQLGVSEHRGFSLQNFGYALQWWAFTGAALFLWVRVIRDRARPDKADHTPEQPAQQTAEHTAAGTTTEAAPPVDYRRYVMPTSVETDDPELARYNAYLRSLGDS